MSKMFNSSAKPLCSKLCYIAYCACQLQLFRCTFGLLAHCLYLSIKVSNDCFHSLCGEVMDKQNIKQEGEGFITSIIISTASNLN